MLLINENQKSNPLIKFIKNTKYEFKSIKSHFEIFNIKIDYLSFEFYLLNPDFIKTLKPDYLIFHLTDDTNNTNEVSITCYFNITYNNLTTA